MKKRVLLLILALCLLLGTHAAAEEYLGKWEIQGLEDLGYYFDDDGSYGMWANAGSYSYADGKLLMEDSYGDTEEFLYVEEDDSWIIPDDDSAVMRRISPALSAEALEGRWYYLFSGGYFDLAADGGGDYVADSSSEALPCTYTISGDTVSITMEGDALSFTLSPDYVLHNEENDVTLVAAPRLSQPASEDAYLGEWYLAYSGSAESLLTLLADGSLSLQNHGEEESGTYTLEGSALTLLIPDSEETTAELSLEEGLLYADGDVVAIRKLSPQERVVDTLWEVTEDGETMRIALLPSGVMEVSAAQGSYSYVDGTLTMDVEGELLDFIIEGNLMTSAEDESIVLKRLSSPAIAADQTLSGAWEVYQDEYHAVLTLFEDGAFHIGTNSEEDTITGSYTFDGKTLYLTDDENEETQTMEMDEDGNFYNEHITLTPALEDDGEPLSGVWEAVEDEELYTLTLNADGSFHMTDGRYTIAGTHTRSGRYITLVTEDGDAEGIYLEPDGSLLVDGVTMTRRAPGVVGEWSYDGSDGTGYYILNEDGTYAYAVIYGTYTVEDGQLFLHEENYEDTIYTIDGDVLRHNDFSSLDLIRGRMATAAATESEEEEAPFLGAWNPEGQSEILTFYSDGSYYMQGSGPAEHFSGDYSWNSPILTMYYEDQTPIDLEYDALNDTLYSAEDDMLFVREEA